MKKKFKLLFSILIIVMIFEMTSVKAASKNYDIEKIGTSSFTLGDNSATKTTYSIPKIKATKVYTTLTNPCGSCVLAVRIYDANSSDWFALGSTIKLNQEKTFIGHDGSANPGTYELGAERVDFTLLKTNARFYWTYD